MTTLNERTEVPIEIASAESFPIRSPLLGRSIDRPTPGPVEGDLFIAGWVLAEPGPVRRVTATANGRLLAHVRPERRRRDLKPVFPEVPHSEQAGFRFRLGAPQLAGVGTITLAAELAEGPSIPFGQVTLARPTPNVVGQTPAARTRPSSGRRLRRFRSGTAPRQAITREADADAPVFSPPVQADAFRADSFRVVALISAYNEADIIEPVLAHLHANEIESYLIDDGSTDGTGECAARWLGRGLLGIERIEKPPDAATSWRALILRKEELAAELGADWYIHHDADEIRESPFPTGTLRDAIRWVDGLGYNAIGFRVLQFRPVDDTFRPGDDPRDHFLRWEDPAEYDRIQRKCWKAGFPGVSLAEDGGHDVRFPDRRLFPVRFLMRHYPIRGQAHGARKVLHERKGRFIQAEIDYGWHKQYDQVDSADHLFLRNPATLPSVRSRGVAARGAGRRWRQTESSRRCANRRTRRGRTRLPRGRHPGEDRRLGPARRR